MDKLPRDLLVMSQNEDKPTRSLFNSSSTRKVSTTCFPLVRPSGLTLLCGLFLVLLSAASVHSIIMPPSKLLYINRLSVGSGLQSSEVDDEPYKLTIIEKDGVSVPINSKSVITINLNKAIPELITVVVSVYSGPGLIVFDQSKALIVEDLAASTRYANATPDNFLITYNANEFGDRLVHFHTTVFAGHAEIVCTVKTSNKTLVVDDKSAYTSVDIYRSSNLNYIIQLVGWIYFFAWSISFYFQVILNYKRKSVVGLNFDFLCLNLLGFACYSIFNFTLLFIHSVQQEYYKKYAYTRIPVEYNDLFFAVHALLITLVTIIQCFIYERGDQHISLPAGIFVSAAPMVGFGLLVANMFGSLSIIYVVLYLSHVKLVITLIKYIPQAYMNYKRRATTGWSIHNIMLDFTGGSFSLLQMFLLAYNYDDWISIFGNFTKFGLGLFSMLFDVVFFTQHYILYRADRRASLIDEANDDLEHSSDSCPSPVISRSITSVDKQPQTAPARNNGSNVDSDDSSD